MRALHGMRLWQAALAVIVAVLAVGLVFALRPVDVPFGTRLEVHPWPLHLSIWVD